MKFIQNLLNFTCSSRSVQDFVNKGLIKNCEKRSKASKKASFEQLK